MKILSKLAFLLLITGALAILLSFAGVGPRAVRTNVKTWLTSHLTPLAVAAQLTQSSGITAAPGEATPALNEQFAPSLVRMPAIRGENLYGWVQLPRGTSVELVQRTAGELLVRWDGTVVRIPQTAALTGAISLRQPVSLAARN